MANTIGWGKATQNNDNGFGKYQNTIGAASIYAESYAGETAIVGTSAAFSYSASTFTQADADPTPTITGTTGGSFNASAGLVFVDTGTFNSSTGQIDLSASTIDSHIITYTVDGVQSGQTVGITAAPFSSTKSFSFDGVDEYFQIGQTTDVINDFSNPWSVSWWAKWTYSAGFDCFWQIGSIASPVRYLLAWVNGTGIGWSISNSVSVGIKYNIANGLNDGEWHNIIFTGNGNTSLTGILNVYVDGVLNTDAGSGTGAASSSLTMNNIGRGFGTNGRFFNGNIDEMSIWDTELSSDAITEIYNSGVPNDLESLTNASSSNLVAWYRMGEEATFSNPGGTGDWTLTDQGSGGNNATSNNMEESDRKSDTP